MQEQIKLVHSAMNPDFAIVEGMVIKLSYSRHGETDPTLEVFENTQWAQEKEWACYGASFDEKNVWTGKNVMFNKLGESQQVKIGGRIYKITFINSGKEKIKYPKGEEDVPFYEFLVE